VDDFRRAQRNLAANGDPRIGERLEVFPLLGFGGFLQSGGVQNWIRNGEIGQYIGGFLAPNRVFFFDGEGGERFGARMPMSFFYTNPNIFVGDVVGNHAFSEYNALQLEVRRSWRQGFTTQINYTWGHAMTDFAGSQSNFRGLFDNAQPELELMRPSWDIRHTINANWVWEIPVGEGRRWMDSRNVLSAVIGGWDLSGFVRIRSGEPINLVSGRGTINRGGSRALTNTVHLTGITPDELQDMTGVDRLPDGAYTAEGFLEDDGVIPDRPWKIRATVVIRGDEVIVDYTGSDPQAAGAINQSFGTTASATYAGIFHMIDNQIPWNHGAYRPIAIVAPPGSIVNVNYPGSCVGGNSDTYPTTVDILLAAFAQASDRSSAADGGTCGLLGFYGTNIDTGEPFVILHHEGMGWGGRRDADGNDAQIVKNGNCLNAPCEVWETRYPVRLDEYSIAEGGAGAGAYRGGHGVQRTWTCLSPITVSAHLNRTSNRAWGLYGGSEGGTTALLFRRAGEAEWRTAREMFDTISDGKFSNVVLDIGDQILLRTPGGGGYGDPRERDPALVLEDVRDLLLEPEEAREMYGVVVNVAAGRAELVESDQRRTANGAAE
jgi:hypothetical protein